MTRDDIDTLIAATQAEGGKGDPAAGPGAIYLNSATWLGLPSTLFPTTCVSAVVGIRYRGLRVLISSHYQDRVASRAECGAAGEPFMELEPCAA